MNVELNSAKMWVKENRNLLRKYKGQWIAYNGQDGVLGHHENVKNLVEMVKGKGKPYILKFVDPFFYSGLRRLVPIRFRPFRQESWEPTISVPISNKNQTATIEMLVDSGADISTISLDLGEVLGFVKHEDEVPEVAAGVNGTVEYVIRKVNMEIEEHVFSAPVAWLLDEKCDDLLLGRETVFDIFDIEFKQKDGEILFRKRSDA